MSSPHLFHIPVLGIGFSVTTPLAVAKYGISSVMSIIDDKLLEVLREQRLAAAGRPYVPIEEDEDDARARRITAWCDMVHQHVHEQFTALRASEFTEGGELARYFEMLPEGSPLRESYLAMRRATGRDRVARLQQQLRDAMRPGSIDVNIMAKVDKNNFHRDGTPMGPHDSDAQAALRGFANSRLRSGVVFSAGMNPRLYSYAASFADFYPDSGGAMKKRIIVKVSDFRSALIQGQYFAKKGLWVSEYRIESGLNCGGHAFATDGLLLGPILEEFRTRRVELFREAYTKYTQALTRIGHYVPRVMPPPIVTVQGGVGTAQEQSALLRHYRVSSVGWGTPFLLVPEATNVDPATRELLRAAGEDDLYLSGISPLGVPFNSLRGNSKDEEKMQRADAGKPGSPCIRKYLELNTELTEKPICSASITFMRKKIQTLKDALPGSDSFKAAYDKAVEKVCLCEGLITSALHAHDIRLPKISEAASVCPGPNLAYFSRISTLREMVDHIYGRSNVMTDPDRPHMFLKELRLYIDYWLNKVQESVSAGVHTPEFLATFRENLLEGIEYYRSFLPSFAEAGARLHRRITAELAAAEETLRGIVIPGLRTDEAEARLALVTA